jgi:hypothetical protein
MKETNKLQSKGTPLAMGKNIAVSITPDKYKLIALLPATPTPQITNAKIKLKIQKHIFQAY